MKALILALPAASLLLAGCAYTQSAREGATAVAALEPRSGSRVTGKITFTRVAPDVVRVTGEVNGHTPGPKGFHVHERGDCSDPKAMSTGGHFNPRAHKHGGPYTPERHAGDLGNLIFDNLGRAFVNISVGGISVSADAPDGIVGRAVIVHADNDDLKTDPTGNAGGRVACGVIRAADSAGGYDHRY